MRTYHSLATFGAMSFLFLVAQTVHAADVSKAKCPISGKPVSEDHAAEYNGGKVYFCCDKCPAKFSKNSAPFAVKANHQLAVTGQAKQENCPLSGKPIDATKTVDVDGTSVAFCCDKCQGKISKEKPAQQMKDCFNDKAFKKAYKVQ